MSFVSSTPTIARGVVFLSLKALHSSRGGGTGGCLYAKEALHKRGQVPQDWDIAREELGNEQGRRGITGTGNYN